MNRITYSDLYIGSLDENFINEKASEYNIDREDLDLTNVFEYLLHADKPLYNSAMLTNEIIYQMMYQIACNEVHDQDDRDTLIDHIFCNCLDSHYDVNIDELNTQEARDLVVNFG